MKTQGGAFAEDPASNSSVVFMGVSGGQLVGGGGQAARHGGQRAGFGSLLTGWVGQKKCVL